VSLRARAAAVQLAAFLCGGVGAPVWHLASHRPDHEHGPDGAATTFHVHADDDHDAHPDHDSEDHDGHDADLDHEHGEAPRADERASTSPVPPPLDHGHGSLAHLGLALLGAPPVVPLPEPEPRPEAAVSASLEPLSLFQPSFPLPRPPPALA
jgi:hypothetical protein